MEVFNILLMPLTLHFDTACHTMKHGIQSMLGITYFYVFFIKFIIFLLYTHILVKGY